MKLFFYDLETTGTNPAKNGIHQISGQIVIDGVVKETFDFKVQPNPRAVIEAEALAVAGVTEEQIKAYPSMQEVFKQLTTLLKKYCNKYDRYNKYFLVGYNNASFDNNFFRGFFLQNDDKYFGSWFWSNTIDVMVLASQHLMNERHLMKDFKLSTVAEHMGIAVESDSLHDAQYDIELTKAIYDIIVNKNNI